MPVFEDVDGKLWEFSEVDAEVEPPPTPTETLRGVNLMDTRGCNACTWADPNADEVIRRALFFAENGANFFRLCMESYGSADGRVNHAFDAPGYLDDILRIVTGIEAMGATVMVSLWIDDTFDATWVPTNATFERHAALGEKLKHTGAWIGLCNEPTQNWNGEDNARRWEVMRQGVQTLRGAGFMNRVAVQGLAAWGRYMDYYYDHRIADRDIIYETHVYGPLSHYTSQVTESVAAGLPILLGEFGPVSGSMTETDALEVQRMALRDGIPSTAWVGHHRCNHEQATLVDHSDGGCGIGMPLELTDWGKALAAIWAS